MSVSGPLTLLIAVVGIGVVLIVAHHSRLLPWLTRRLEGRHPPEPRSEYGRGNVRVLPPRSLPRGDLYSDCSLYNWQGGDDAA